MKVVLLQDIAGLGYEGDIVEAKPGHVANYLLPAKKVALSTDKNLAILKDRLEKVRKRVIKDQEKAKSLAETMKALELEFFRRTSDEERLFGSVTTADIALALEEKGFNIHKKDIVLPTSIQSLGNQTVKIRLFREVFTEILVKVMGEDSKTA